MFCPELAKDLDPDSLEFLDKEIFTDVTHGEKHQADIVAWAKFKGKGLGFLIHVEPQARHETHFRRRMFTYFARFHEKYEVPVYPIALYLQLTIEERQDFKAEIEKLVPQEKEGVMEIVTSWKKEGLEEGLANERNLVVRQLRKQVGRLPDTKFNLPQA